MLQTKLEQAILEANSVSGICLAEVDLGLLLSRGGSRTAVTSNMERFVIIVNGFQPLTIITKRSILDVAATLDPTLLSFHFLSETVFRRNSEIIASR